MPTPANPPTFTFTLPGAPAEFRVLAFKGHEALNRPYAFELDLLSEQRQLDLDALLHQPAFLTFAPGGGGIHGAIEDIARGEAGTRFTRYAVTLRPRLARLAHRVNQRIFQHRSVPQIITQLLQEHGILGNAHRFELRGAYPPRDYCVQYAESDLHFLQRLCEEEGLSYHFRHRPDGHLLVFGEDTTAFPKLAPARYQPGNGLAAEGPGISRLSVSVEARTSLVTRHDHDFTHPRVALEVSHRSDAGPLLEDYHYPGRFTHRTRGTQLATRALERHRADYCVAEGRSDLGYLASGHGLPLAGHPHPSCNGLWVLTEVHHEGRQPQALEETAPSARPGRFQGYRNRFKAIPHTQAYRPPLAHPKPRLPGTQTAVVTGPASEEVHCDNYGRVKVQFHWDRDGQGNDHSSRWVRVASGWAGARHGGLVLPRVGMEVLVSFLDGDPDQPLVTGCLYHGEHLPPHDLPGHKTQSTFKSLSSPGGGGGNTLRIEDRQGQEQIFIHAQRDWAQQIGRNQQVEVGHQRHDSVAGNAYTAVEGEEHRITQGERKVHVRGNDHLSVGGSQHIRVGEARRVEAGREVHFKAGQQLVIEAGLELTLKCGDSFLRLDAGGIHLGGPQLRVNAGGSPGEGSGARPQRPQEPKGVSGTHPGRVMEGPGPSEPGEPSPTPKHSPAARVKFSN